MDHWKHSVLLAVPLTLLLCAGCGLQEEPAAAPAATPSGDGGTVSSVAASESVSQGEAQSQSRQPVSGVAHENIGFKNGAGDRLYEIKFKDNGAKLVDPDEQELARFTVSGRKLKIKLPDDSVAGSVTLESNGFEIRDSDGKTELFDLKRQPDGDWKLKTADETPLAVLKKRDYGYEIEDPQETSLFKAKLKSGKSSLRDAADQTVLYTKDPIPTLCVAVLGLEQIESLPLRAGLSAAVLLLSNEGSQ